MVRLLAFTLLALNLTALGRAGEGGAEHSPFDQPVPSGPAPGKAVDAPALPAVPLGTGGGFLGAVFDYGVAKSYGAFVGRSAAGKPRLLQQYGGNERSEQAVARGLEWLAAQQKRDGSWEFEVGSKECKAAATGLVLLAFVGAGETHKDPKGKYKDVVKNGLQWMMKATPLAGQNSGRVSANMYEQGIATLALCDAYGATKDLTLKPYAQAAIRYLQKAQGPNGSWGYSSGANGDTSIVGWQIQALQAAKMSKDLAVDDKAVQKAVKFLDFVAVGEKKSMYGYAGPQGAAPGTALTAVGLLCRYHIDAWDAKSPGMSDGVAGLAKNPPGTFGAVRNMYYYYYATQVVRYCEGDEWQAWNEGAKQADGTRRGGMRDWIVGAQVTDKGSNFGSWNPEAGWFGTQCGRLGTTAVCVLNLEVYYRYAPSEVTAGRGANPKK